MKSNDFYLCSDHVCQQLANLFGDLLNKSKLGLQHIPLPPWQNLASSSVLHTMTSEQFGTTSIDSFAKLATSQFVINADTYLTDEKRALRRMPTARLTFVTLLYAWWEVGSEQHPQMALLR